MPDAAPDPVLRPSPRPSVRREWQIHDLVAWAKADPAHSIGAVAARLGMPAGRKWSEIPDAEVDRLWWWCCRGDTRSDDEFDNDIKF